MRKVPALRMALVGLALASVATAARGDDWPQFRRDGRRTAASSDHLQLPLTDLWSAPGEGLVTWRGRAYYVGPDAGIATVFCVDLRTGQPKWKVPLSYSWSASRYSWATGTSTAQCQIADADGGILYVWDHIPRTPAPGGAPPPGSQNSFRDASQRILRALRAKDGAPVATMSSLTALAPSPQLILFDGRGDPVSQPLQRGIDPVGTTVVVGRDAIVSSVFDALFRWTAGGPAEQLFLAHMNPQSAPEPGLTAIRQLGFPPASVGSGIVVGGTSTWSEKPLVRKQHLAVVSEGTCLWHRDYLWGLAYPTVESGLILTGAGSPGGRRGIMAHDAGTGAVRWVYPREGIRPDSLFEHSSFAAANGVSRDRSGRASTSFQSAGGSVRLFSATSGAHVDHAGIAVASGRAYAQVFGDLVALQVDKGELLWRWPLPRGEVARSIVVSPKNVLVSLRPSNTNSWAGRLVALRLADGKPEWNVPFPDSGTLALSNGLLFLSNQSVHAFAPAERTYRMAVDSPRKEDYDLLTGWNRDRQAVPDAVDEDTKVPERKPAEKAIANKALADATVVRLYWGDPVEKMLGQLRERQAAAPGLPLLVALEWLDPTRTTIRGGQPGWSAQDIASFAALCERLAREGSPQHLDLAPEVDVYLSRDFRRLPVVQELIRAATAAVKRGSPQTRVLVSFNRELLARRYGQGSYLPFGKLPIPGEGEQGQLLNLLSGVDEVGLTSIPQSAFNSAAEIPGDYLLALKEVLPRHKPLLITRLAVRCDEADRAAEITQAVYLKHLFQIAYWLDAELMVYPELLGRKPGGEKTPDVALRVDERERPALAYWRDTLQWKRVSRLTAVAADFKLNLH